MIIRTCLEGNERAEVLSKLFGPLNAILLEANVFAMAESLSDSYKGGMWLFYMLDDGGFYMAPNTDAEFVVQSSNGSLETMSADAFGITVCLFVYSHLSFDDGKLAELCSEHYHCLREYMMDHAEVRSILTATD